MAAPAIVFQDVSVPRGALTLSGFRAWVASLPESGPRPRPTFCPGGIFVEMSPRDVEGHGPITAQVNAVLYALCAELELGEYHLSPTWFTSVRAGLSNEPDGAVVLWESLRSRRVRVNPACRAELLGAPDWALEVVSRSSAAKDLVHLVQAYAKAGVREYWIVDSRDARPTIALHTLAGRRLRPVDSRDARPTIALHTLAGRRLRPVAPGRGGWVESPFWGRAFRLVRGTNPVGGAAWRLEVRARRRAR